MRVAGWAGVLNITVLSLVPGPESPHTGQLGPLEHYAAYLPVGFALALGYRRRLQVLATALLLPLYAGLLEIAQLFIRRSSKLIDFFVSGLGVWTGLVLALIST
jgi:VanZ family protein